FKMYPFTHSQRLIWLSQEFSGEPAVNNMAFAFRWREAVDVELLRKAFAALVAECDVMQLGLPGRGPLARDGSGGDLGPGGPRPETPGLERVTVEDYDLPFHDFSTRPDELRPWMEQRIRRPFGAGELLFDVALFRLGPEDYVLYLNQHHWITDGWGFALQTQWLYATYRRLQGEEVEVPVLASFSDYLAEYPALVADARAKKARTYWEEYTEKLPEAPKLFGRTNQELRAEATRITEALSPELLASLRAVLQAPDVRSFSEDLSLLTVFATVTLAYAYRISGQRELCLGMPFHNRTRPVEKQSPGLFMEIFPLGVTVAEGETFGSLLEKVREGVMDYLRHVRTGGGGLAG
ncbi:MAG: condensation domain-containing protein, partial [Bacteroidota bacterium]